MSRENVEMRNGVVRRWLETFESDPVGFRETLHPEVEWFPIEENHSRYYGIESAMRCRDNWLETWDAHGTLIIPTGLPRSKPWGCRSSGVAGEGCSSHRHQPRERLRRLLQSPRGGVLTRDARPIARQ